jgi:hypothetical protein
MESEAKSVIFSLPPAQSTADVSYAKKDVHESILL